MNIQYHFSVLVFLIVLERSHLDCYTTIGYYYKIWMRTEKRFLAWSELTGMVNFGKI